MNRVRLLLIGLPIFLFFIDISNLFSPKPGNDHDDIDNDHQNQYQPKSQAQIIQEPLPFPTRQKPQINIGAASGLGNTVNIAFCTSCSYKGTAVTMKNVLESSFPGINVVLENYPPSVPKRIVSKLVTVGQVGIFGTVLLGDKIFPRLGITTPPHWYHSMCANKFRSLATVWMFGNFAHSSLQSTGAFEVHCNGQLVFSKLREQRFPGEIELSDLVGRTLQLFDREAIAMNFASS